MTSVSSPSSVGPAAPSKIDIVLAIALSVFVYALSTRIIDPGADVETGGVVAGSLAVLMTLPVAVRRQWAFQAAAFVAAADWVNGLAFPDFVRCGPGLPAVFLIAYSCGLRLDKRSGRIGLLLCAVGVVGQAQYDQALGLSALVLILPLTVGAWGTGRLVLRRQESSVALAASNAELRVQREANARLAVAADREAVAGDLDSFLHEQIGGIAARAAEGSDALAHDPEAARRALEDIEESGRSTLNQMRSVVGSLKESPDGPQPVLAQLSELVARAAVADARLDVEGDPRQLPAGIELSGYRIVEHLLTAMSEDRRSKVKVTVTFGDDALELAISGSARGEAARTALAAAKERVALHGGTLTSTTRLGRADVHARLPLPSGV
ncbi:sensor histidine kinase [Nocardioides marmorisolisilvae]|uniref:histidine kinase n=1 Tax=Nocardioides marmorisolisilvae TaxID=1542737 RepID=A0A3N0DV11_9ACTN|nr:histidine kinase [Nocardioides marmorisolisilvae]RNL79457.1 hypothetical protein EFL95_10755 [Nocardioides marmorisolisilvae]